MDDATNTSGSLLVGWAGSGVSFHLKLIAAAAGGLADPLTLVDTQRRELPRRLRDAQRAAK